MQQPRTVKFALPPKDDAIRRLSRKRTLEEAAHQNEFDVRVVDTTLFPFRVIDQLPKTNARPGLALISIRKNPEQGKTNRTLINALAPAPSSAEWEVQVAFEPSSHTKAKRKYWICVIGRDPLSFQFTKLLSILASSVVCLPTVIQLSWVYLSSSNVKCSSRLLFHGCHQSKERSNNVPTSWRYVPASDYSYSRCRKSNNQFKSSEALLNSHFINKHRRRKARK